MFLFWHLRAATSRSGCTSFREFPPRQKPGSFSLDRVMESVTQPPQGDN